jgi:hypothetical protein
MDLARQSARVGAVTLPTGQISRGDFAGTSRPAEYLTFSSGTFVEAMGLEPTNLPDCQTPADDEVRCGRDRFWRVVVAVWTLQMRSDGV